MEPLRSEVAKLLEASNSQNTWKTYQNGLASFDSFRKSQGIRDAWPPSISDVVNYVAYMSNSNYAPSTVKSYLSGLSFWLKTNNLDDPTQSFIIQKMLRGMEKLYGRPDSRKPITLSLLTRLIDSLQYVCSSSYECSLFRAMFSLSFFAFLRIGEITVNTNSQYILSNLDVKISGDLTGASITIPFSKTDQNGLSTTLVVGKSEIASICPIYLLSSYLKIRHIDEGPLFCHFNKKGVTRFQFSKLLCKSLQFNNCNPNEFNTHSFRIGAATHCAMSGQSEQVIMTKGRWKSACFKRYIRIDLTN